MKAYINKLRKICSFNKISEGFQCWLVNNSKNIGVLLLLGSGILSGILYILSTLLLKTFNFIKTIFITFIKWLDIRILYIVFIVLVNIIAIIFYIIVILMYSTTLGMLFLRFLFW